MSPTTQPNLQPPTPCLPRELRRGTALCPRRSAAPPAPAWLALSPKATFAPRAPSSPGRPAPDPLTLAPALLPAQCTHPSCQAPHTRWSGSAGHCPKRGSLGPSAQQHQLQTGDRVTALVRGREGLPLFSRPDDSVPRPWPHTFLSPGQTPSTLPLAALSRSTLSRAGCSYFKSSMGVSPRDIQAHEPHRRGALSA